MPIDTTVGGAPPAGVAPEAWFPQRYVLNTTSPLHANGLPRFVPDPAAPTSGRTVMVCNLKSSDPVYTPGYPAQRTEIAVEREYTPPGEERWYAMSLYLDQYWPVYDKTTMFVLAQLHTSQHTWTATPPLHISARGDNLTLTLRHNTRPVAPTEEAATFPPYADYYASKYNSTELFVDLGKVLRQMWYCFVINAMWSNTARSGHLKIWMNGQIVHQQLQAPNCYENLKSGLGNWIKMGVYAPGGFGPMWDGKVAWVKNYVHWISVASPQGIGPADMYAQTPYSGPIEPAFPAVA